MRKKNPLDFVIPADDLQPFLDDLGNLGHWHDTEVDPTLTQRTYFDSFEWGLFNDGLLLYKENQEIHLLSKKAGETYLSAQLKRDPIWPDKLPSTPIRKRVAPLCKYRRLFPKCIFQVETRRLALMDELEKTILRLELRQIRSSEGEFILHHLRVHPLTGYDHALETCIQALAATGNVPMSQDFGFQLLATANLNTRSHKQRLRIQLQDLASLPEALSSQLTLLADDVEHHRCGVIEDFDTEFLHQFRIAVRKSRSLLSYFRKDLPAQEVEFASALLRSWGQITNPLRDLDVLLLDEDTYRELLPEEVRPSLDAFFKQLKRRRTREKRTLANFLAGNEFRLEFKQLEISIKQMSPGPCSITIPLEKALFERLRKRLKKLRALLQRCIAGVPEEELHRLRIQIKKLRYILTTFEALFPKVTFQEALRQLKRCQNVLGERHDMEWQRGTLLATITGGKDHRLPSETVKAIAMLAGVIHARHQQQWPEVQQGLQHLESVSFKKLLDSLKN